MKQQNGQAPGVSLYVTLTPQDAELLRAAVPAGTAPRDRLGIQDTGSLAQMALGAIARAILRQGYQPRPLGAEMRHSGSEDQALPPGVIKVQLA